jgi:hypothetical protein
MFLLWLNSKSKKIKSANISDESVINKITGDSYLVVIKVENVMTFKTSVLTTIL